MLGLGSFARDSPPQITREHSQKGCSFPSHTREAWRKAVQACYGGSTEQSVSQTSPPGSGLHPHEARPPDIHLYSRQQDGRRKGEQLPGCSQQSLHFRKTAPMSSSRLSLSWTAFWVCGPSSHPTTLPGKHQGRLIPHSTASWSLSGRTLSLASDQKPS